MIDVGEFLADHFTVIVTLLGLTILLMAAFAIWQVKNERTKR